MQERKGIQLLYSCLNMRSQLNNLLQSGSLSQGEYLVLRNIRHANSSLASDGILNGNIKAATLSDILALSRPSITRILNGLEKRGLITRSINKKDRRSVAISITEEGITALDEANKALLKITNRLVTSLGEADMAKLIELVDKVAEVYEEMYNERGHTDD